MYPLQIQIEYGNYKSFKFELIPSNDQFNGNILNFCKNIDLFIADK